MPESSPWPRSESPPSNTPPATFATAAHALTRCAPNSCSATLPLPDGTPTTNYATSWSAVASMGGDPLHARARPPPRPLLWCSEPAFPLATSTSRWSTAPDRLPSVFLARSRARHIARSVRPMTVCPIQVSLEVGLRAGHSEPLGKGSHLAKSLDRFCHHRLVKPLGTDTLVVGVEVPAFKGRSRPASPRQRATCVNGAWSGSTDGGGGPRSRLPRPRRWLGRWVRLDAAPGQLPSLRGPSRLTHTRGRGAANSPATRTGER